MKKIFEEQLEVFELQETYHFHIQFGTEETEWHHYVILNTE